MGDNKYKVLVIDDDENTVATIKSQISVLYDVAVALGGEEAIELLYKDRKNRILFYWTSICLAWMVIQHLKIFGK